VSAEKSRRRIAEAREHLSVAAAVLGAAFYGAQALALDDVKRVLRALAAAQDALRRTGGS
jgi:cyanate lyase